MKTTGAAEPEVLKADVKSSWVTVYGLRQPVALGPLELFSMSVAGGPEKVIGSLAREYSPSAGFSPSLRLSLTPDGKSLTYATLRSTSNLWLVDGLKSVTAR